MNRNFRPLLSSVIFAVLAALPISGCNLVGEVPGSSTSLSASQILANRLLASPDFVTDNSQITSKTLTAFLVVKTSARGTVFSLNPVSPTNQAFQVVFGASDIKASYLTSASDTTEAAKTLPSAEYAVVGVSFSEDPSLLDLTVNGSLAAAPVFTGMPTTPLQMTRYTEFDSVASNLKEVLLFKRALTREEHSAMLEYVAAKHKLTVALDPALKIPSNTSSDPNFAPAQNIIQAKCLSCHGAWNGVSANYYFSTGLAIKGQAENSQLYYRLTGSSGAQGPKTMPTSGSISASEADLIKTWINQAP
jgi:hypothetical protein